jgi:hypothetical protein
VFEHNILTADPAPARASVFLQPFPSHCREWLFFMEIRLLQPERKHNLPI